MSDVVANGISDVLRGLFAALVEALFMAPLRAIAFMLTRPAFAEADVEDIRPLRHRVLREGRPLEDAIWAGDDQARHFLLRWAGTVVAVATVMERQSPGEPARLQLRGMAVGPEHQGKGLGAQLLSGLQGAVGEPLWCNARESAVPFYNKQGWRVFGDEFDIEGIGPHRHMISP